jgi:replication initiation and membrane attachment protein DnaB
MSSDLNKVEIQVFNYNNNSLFEDVLAAYLSTDAKFKSAKSCNKNDFNFESLQYKLTANESIQYKMGQDDLVYIRFDGSELSITQQR